MRIENQMHLPYGKNGDMTGQGTHCGRKNVDERFIYTVKFSPFAKKTNDLSPHPTHSNAHWNKTRIYHYGLVIGLSEIHHMLQLQGPYDKKVAIISWK